MPIIWGLTEEKQSVSARPLAAEHERNKYLERKRLGLCIKCGRKVEAGRTKCGVCLGKDREQKKALHPLFCGECKGPIKSKRDLLAEGFTGYVLRNGKPEGIPINTGRLL